MIDESKSEQNNRDIMAKKSTVPDTIKNKWEDLKQTIKIEVERINTTTLLSIHEEYFDEMIFLTVYRPKEMPNSTSCMNDKKKCKMQELWHVRIEANQNGQYLNLKASDEGINPAINVGDDDLELDSRGYLDMQHFDEFADEAMKMLKSIRLSKKGVRIVKLASMNASIMLADRKHKEDFDVQLMN